MGAVVCQFDACCHAAPLTKPLVLSYTTSFPGQHSASQHDRDQLDSMPGVAQMNEEEFAKFLGTFVQAVWMQLVQVSLRPGQARSQALGKPCICCTLPGPAAICQLPRCVGKAVQAVLTQGGGREPR